MSDHSTEVSHDPHADARTGELVPGANVRFRVFSKDSNEAFDFANVQSATEDIVVLDVADPAGERGEYLITARQVPRRRLDATVVPGEGIHGLLDWHFRPLQGDRGQDLVRRFDSAKILEPAWGDLLARYAERLSPTAGLDLLMHVFSLCRLQTFYVDTLFHEGQTLPWLRAFNWRAEAPYVRELTALEHIVEPVRSLHCLPLDFVADALERLEALNATYPMAKYVRERHSWLAAGGAYLLVPILWETLRSATPTTGAEAAYEALADRLLVIALKYDQAFHALPDAWVAMEPLPGTAVRHAQRLAEAAVETLESGNFDDLLAIKRSGRLTRNAWRDVPIESRDISRIIVGRWWDVIKGDVEGTWDRSPLFTTLFARGYEFDAEERAFALDRILGVLVERPTSRLVRRMFGVTLGVRFWGVLSPSDRLRCGQALAQALRTEAGRPLVADLSVDKDVLANPVAREALLSVQEA